MHSETAYLVALGTASQERVTKPLPISDITGARDEPFLAAFAVRESLLRLSLFSFTASSSAEILKDFFSSSTSVVDSIFALLSSKPLPCVGSI